jgi:hypothetical protein
MIGFAIGVKNISSEVPAKFNLYQNYPNPFNPVTKMKFDIPLTPQSPLEGGIRGVREGLVDDSKSRQTRGAVRLIIYDALGREAATLVNEPLSPGSYEVEFDGSNLPSGVYFYRVTSGEYSDTKKMIMVK